MSEAELDLIVDRVVPVADGVVELILRAADSELPAWEPGAHVDLELRPGLVRQYSLSGDPADRTRWRLGVLREPAGRGGSAFVHDDLGEGAKVRARGPRNHFALHHAARHLFIAGGIGITPIVPMLAAARSDWRLVYGGRTRASMAFVDELVAAYRDRIDVRPQDATGLLDLDTLLADIDANTLVYCCGPESLLAAVEARVPAGQLHVERFAPRELGDPVRTDGFEVELAQAGLTLTVPPDRSILHTLEDAGITVLSSCQEGTCGTCETAVLEGEPDHRDSLLTPDERAANDTMFICVSRSCSPRLVLDL